ncbi:alpha/beta fold hydrolase [Altererythrobacter oceanensis]|uniref:Alpha/beta fold hydrolase n=1 Tax=Qipengyuania oceanensis TaxID=1463597 RepID=A0A844YH46_9SPHN|nr:alpha/beta fold hydrolase [Qipengyuania oceanensis]
MIVAAFLLSTFSSEALAERPLEYFATLPTFSNPTLSPDGTKIAVEMAVDGEQRMVIIGLDGSSKPVVVSAGETEIWDIDWVGNDWLVLNVVFDGRISERSLFGEETQMSRLIAFKADGTDLHTLESKKDKPLANGGNVIWTGDDENPEILISYPTSVFWKDPGFFPLVMRVNVPKNRFSLELNPHEQVRNYYTDADGVIRFGVGHERGGRRVRLIYRDGAGSNLKERAWAEGDDDLPVPSVFLEDGKSAIALATVDGYQGAYKLDLETMTFGEKVYGVNGYDLDGIITVDGELAGYTWVDTVRQNFWIDPRLKTAQELLDLTFPGKKVSILTTDDDRNRVVASIGTAAGPSEYYLLDVAKKDVRLLAKPLEQLARGGNGSVTTVTYSARDGLKIPAILTLPPGREAKGLPLIVLPHGGPRARDIERWDWWSQFLADRGYAVIQPNYRGSTGFGKAFVDAGDGEWGLKMQDDVDDAVTWAVEKGLADPERVCIVGGSYGGYVAMRAAQRNPDIYRCAISFAGVSDMPRMLRYSSDSYFGPSSREYWLGRADDLARVSPINHVDKFGIPILLVHGKEDWRVPINQSRELAEKLKAAGKDVVYIEQAEGDHFFSRMADRAQFLEEMEKFLDKHNPAS